VKGIGGHQRAFRGRTDEWLTPPEIIEALGPFDLDPCSPRVRPWPTATTHYTIEDDGLAQPWSGSVWLNPPYGPQSGKWLERLAAHNNGIALMFARTDAEWFHRYVWNAATALKFLRGRLHFHSVDGKRSTNNSGGPSVLIAYGHSNAMRILKSPMPGKYVPLLDGA
jgi:hypothetical protein